VRWVNIVLKEEANAKWISTNAKFCPWCNKAVERSQGCNFMACLCGKSFCYMCSKPWEPDHKDHFRCHIFKKDDATVNEANKIKAALEKINFFAQKFVMTNGIIDELQKFNTFEKREFLYSKLGIELNESIFINDAYKFAIECCESLKWIYVFSYFVDFVDPKRKEQFLFFQGQYEAYKENLMKKLGYDLRIFLESIQKAL
jgi:ariadne-1